MGPRMRVDHPWRMLCLAAIVMFLGVRVLADDTTPGDAHAGSGSVPADVGPDARGDIERLLHQLNAAKTPAEARSEAAKRLIAHADPVAVQAVAATLEAGGSPASTLAQAIEWTETPPMHLRVELVALADRMNGEALRATLRALSRFTERRAVASVMGRLERWKQDPTTLAPESLEAALSTLRAQTGLSGARGHAWTPDEWLGWWEDQRLISAEAWAHATAERQRAAGRRAEERTQTLLEQLREAYRQLYVISSDDQRSTLIAGLIDHRDNALSHLGLELAERSLFNARPLDASVATALGGLLEPPGDERTPIAATLLERMNDASQLDRVRAALVGDTLSAQGAAPLLRLAARHPSTEVVGPVLAWATRASPARPAALLAGATLLEQSLLDAAARDTLRRAALEQLEASPTPAAVDIVAQTGNPAALVPLLSGPDEAVALAAAKRLGKDPTLHRYVVDAAFDRPALLGSAIDALATHRATDDGFRTAVQVVHAGAGSSPDQRLAALKTVFLALPPVQRLEAVASVEDGATRAALLAHAGTAAFHAATPEGERPADDAPRAELLAMLAETRLEAGAPQGALEALDARPAELMTDRLRLVRVHCLVMLAQLEEAAALSAELAAERAAEAWVRAIERLDDPQAAAAAIAVLRQRLGDGLTPPLLERLAVVEGASAADGAGADAAQDEGDPSPPRAGNGSLDNSGASGEPPAGSAG
jgi:hypothetical protein